MLEYSFIFLNGIGETTERSLWTQGISTWECFLEHPQILGIAPGRKAHYDRQVQDATRHWKRRNARYFGEIFKARDHWRIYGTFHANAAFVDIETDGLPPAEGQITLVGIYGRHTMTTLIQGESLTEDRLQEELASYDMLVTFLGSGFDLPFIKTKYPRVVIDQPHFDLCFAARRLGLKGGLKSVEVEMGCERPSHLQGLTGWDAVHLWKAWEEGHTESRKLLLDYNQADCQNLKPLADLIYNRLAQQYGPPDRKCPLL